MPFKIAIALLICNCAMSVAIAQLPTGGISGIVEDDSGAAIPNATLTAVSRETGRTRLVKTSSQGYYKLSALPVGAYDVRAEAPSFKSEVQQDLRLAVGQDAVLNFRLQIGSVQETVTVTANAPLVETTSGSLGGLVDENRVSDLPLNGRSFNSLVLLQPGISIYKTSSPTSTLAAGLNYSSNGAPVRSNFLMLDGANLLSSGGLTGVSVTGSMLGVEGIREFRVVTNSFPAEYGMTMGSQMAVVSKGGTNQLHGSVFEFLRNSAMDTRDFFDRKARPEDQRLPPFRRNNFGGSLGGPAVKDKVFFFITYEGVRDFTARTIPINVPTLAARQDGGLVPAVASVVRPYLNLFPLPTEPLVSDPSGLGGVARNVSAYPRTTREDFGQARSDFNYSESGNLFLRYTITDAARTNPADFPTFQDLSDSRGQYITLADNHTLLPTLLNMVRVSYSRSIQNYDSPSDPALGFMPGLQMGTMAPGSGITRLGPISTRPSANYIDIQTFSDDIFWTRGVHNIKFGTLINRYRFFGSSSSNFKGAYTFANLSQFLLGVPRQLSIATPGSIPDKTFRWSTFGFYIQDDWRVMPNFTLNVGLRYEFHNTVSETTGKGASLRDLHRDAKYTFAPALYENPSLRNFGPRLGFAWDVAGDLKTAVRGGFGFLYDIANFASGASGLSPSVANTTLSTNLGFPFTSIPAATAGRSLRIVDFHMQQPHLLQYNFTIERRLPADIAVSASYAGARGLNLFQNKEGNPTWPVAVVDGREFWSGTEPRMNPNFDDMELKTAGSDSWYNSLQLSLQKRVSRGLQFQSSYTWSKSLDTTQGLQPGEGGGGFTTSTNPNNILIDKGPSDFDTRHSWTLNAFYQVSLGLSGVARILDAWRLSSIFTAKSGLPFTPVLSGNRSRSKVAGGSTQAPDPPDLLTGRKPDDIIRGGPDQYFDPSAFAVQPAGFLGTASRNFLQGPATVNLDFSLAKEVPLRFLGEAGHLDFRAEIFNIFNHTNFIFPVAGRTVFTADNTQASNIPLTTAGQIDRTLTSSRQVQLAPKILF